MGRGTKKSLLLAGILMLCALSATGHASAATYTPCSFTILQQDCARYQFPLDRTGNAGGTTDVQVIKVDATEGPKLGTLFVIAGGPGQPSNVMLDFMTSLFGGANRYDLIAIDQRGTGASEPLDCPAVESGLGETTPAKQDATTTRCATALGPARAGYTTAESVADMEAVRQDLGIDKISLFGVSYGTKVALEYAQTYPTHVKSMMIDSVLPVNEPGPFDLVSVDSMRKALTEVCSDGRCKDVLSAPLTKLNRLATRIATVPISGTILSSTGKPQTVKITATDLYDLLFEADFNLYIYEEIPSTIDAALRGNNTPLLRLFSVLTQSGDSVKTVRSKAAAKAHWKSPQAPAIAKLKRERALAKAKDTTSDVATFSNTLNLTTSCEDFTPPWVRGSPVGSARQPAIDAAANAIPDSAFYPFERKTIEDDSLASICRGWPEASPAPSTADVPLPNVPLLALDGSLDIRTPVAWARSAVASDPQAQVVVIPHTGHSTIGTDVSGCALSLAKRFLIFGGTDGKCTHSADPVPVAPRALDSIKQVKPLTGSCRGIKPRKCLGAKQAVSAGYSAFRDALDQYVVGGMSAGPGLNGGSWVLDYDDSSDFTDEVPSSIEMSGMEEVPGVVADGRVSVESYPRVSGHFEVTDFGGLSYTVSITGKLGFDQRDDQITLHARSHKVRVTLKRGSGKGASRATTTATALNIRSRFADSVGTRISTR